MKQLHRQFRNTHTAVMAALVAVTIAASFGARLAANDDDTAARLSADPGRHVFERETFGGNGRTCLTCHSRGTGTVSPADAQERFSRHPNDPLFSATAAMMAPVRVSSGC
jgi:hypothetical protein